MADLTTVPGVYSWWGRGFHPSGKPKCLPPPAQVLTLAFGEDEKKFWQTLAAHLDAGGLIAGGFGYDGGFPKAQFGLYPPAPTGPWIHPPEIPLPEYFPLDIDDQGARLTNPMWQAVRQCLERGESYQVNLTDRLVVRTRGSGLRLFHTLRGGQDAPYAVYLPLGFGETEVLSFSPELFFRRQGDFIETKPMKGTSPRHSDPTLDEAQGHFLTKDPKSLSENLMIVDLLRNDLSRICVAGSVHVPQMFTVERHPTLWQMTSTISGRLMPNTSLGAIYRALFPCGSVVGAPKISTQHIIAGIEKSPRGLYCGAIGWATVREACFNVSIRTLVGEPGRYVMGVGSGLVEASRLENEQTEWKFKSAFLTHTLRPRGLFTTLRVAHGEPLQIQAHQNRLAQSAETFAWPWDTQAFLASVRGGISKADPLKIYRLRLVLDSKGNFSSDLNEIENLPEKPVVAIYPEPVSSRNLLLFHKTTNREFYERAQKWGSSRGYWEVFFKNERGEITEGTRHNLMVRLGGYWVTPPLTSGLLPGTERKSWLDCGKAREGLIFEEDLIRAEEIVIGNALRPAYPVTLPSSLP